MKRIVAILTLGASAAACATKQLPPPGPPVDLQPARAALEQAREAGAETRAAESFGRAQGHLNEAEALAADPSSSDKRRQSEWLGRLATVEAQCAAQLARQQVQQSDQRSQVSKEADRRNAQLRRLEEDQRRLEEQVALLKRELDFTENEVIRTKSRLKGIETKAEASSAIAEGRILLSRLIEERGNRSQDVQRAREALERAEMLLQEPNFGASIFFALKAQDVAMKAREARPALGAAEHPAPSKSYRVSATSANLREGPGPGEPILGTVPRGTFVKASVVRGDWIRVEHAGKTGWIHYSLLE